MVRRTGKKGKAGKVNKGNLNSPLEINAPQGRDNSSEGSPFLKILIFVGVILAFLYGPSLFKGIFQGGIKEGLQAVSQPPSKIFSVKKIIQFSGSDTQGKPFFANDIIAVGSHELAVTDNLGGQVLIYDLKGKLVRKWGKNGMGPKDFREPSGIATDGKGHLFVMDTMNNAIKTFDVEGKLLHTQDLAHYGVFPTPRRIGFEKNCFLITNNGDNRLFRLSQSGELLSTWGEKNVCSGGLWSVSKTICDPKGKFYVGNLSSKNSTVQVFDPLGNIAQVIKTGVPSDSLALDSQGRLFVGSYGEASKVFDSTGNWLGFLVDEAQPTLMLNQVAGIDIQPNGTLLTCGGDNVTIYQITQEKEK